MNRITAVFLLAAWSAAAGSERLASILQAHTKFLASDLLEGRDTPSRGLDLAAEYIATQFALAGLETAGPEGYFQTAELLRVTDPGRGWNMQFKQDGLTVDVPVDQTALLVSPAFSFENMPLVKVTGTTELRKEEIEGKAVITDLSPASERRRAISALGPRVLIFVNRNQPKGRGFVGPRVIDPEAPRTTTAVNVYGEVVVKFFDTMPSGSALAWTIDPAIERVHAKNVAGILRGSDPVLRGTYVVLSAHYDHVGMAESGEDRIFNGANDNASGTAAVIALAHELSKQRPKRSILFITYFGEEKGLYGSRYYARHPLVPIKDTVAQINMEQLGRTDDDEGARIASLFVTGFHFSDVAQRLAIAGKAVGVNFVDHAANSDAFFDRSDNESLALKGVPAHTVGASFEFPDYHKVSDEAGKLDYENFAKVTRAIGAGVLAIANDPVPPKWNEANDKAKPFRSQR